LNRRPKGDVNRVSKRQGETEGNTSRETKSMEETYTKGDINNGRDRVEDRGKEEGEDIGNS
jgi:hypothetical protein